MCYWYSLQKVFPCVNDFKTFPHFTFYLIHCVWLMSRSLIHLELNVQGDKYQSICVLLRAAIHFDQHHLLTMLSFLHCKHNYLYLLSHLTSLLLICFFKVLYIFLILKTFAYSVLKYLFSSFYLFSPVLRIPIL